MDKHAALGQGLLDIDDHDDHDDLLQHADRVQEAMNTDQPQFTPQADPPKIRVVVRTRPMNSKELEKEEDDILEVDMPEGCVYVNEPKTKVDLTKFTERHKFVFDDSMDHSVSNDTVYSYTVQPLVHTVFKLGKATCFAYGQTGSGKTYTMSPLPPRAAAEILGILTTPDFRDLGLFVSCFEIYGNKVYDLLNARRKLDVREDSKKKVNVVGLKEFHITEHGTVVQLIEHSAAARQTGQTGANAESSRSHSIMQFSLKKPKADGTPGGREVGRLSFIDLAGSERGADTFDNAKQTRLEGAEINKSLLALKECIRALDGDAPHVPFRGSKLTEVLRDSFVGAQARTVMIANVSPGSASVEHTLNTLRYADRVKELRKDKRQRSASMVTPGTGRQLQAFGSMAVARADSMRPVSATVGQQCATGPQLAQPATHAGVSAAPAADAPARQPFVMRNTNGTTEGTAYGGAGRVGNSTAPPQRPGRVKGGGGGNSATAPENLEALKMQLEDARNRYFEEEDILIQSHRKAIEDTMNTVRSEMNLLAEVDQPGSKLDAYVERLEAILHVKDKATAALRAKIESFRATMRREDALAQRWEQLTGGT